MKKLTQINLAEFHQISRSQLCRIKDKGVDIQDKMAVRESILNQTTRPRDWVNGCPWDKPEDKIKPESDIDLNLEDLCKLDLSKLHEEVSTCVDYNEARFIKTKISALKELMQLSIAMREHLPKSEVIEDIKVITSVIGSALDKLPFDLPAVIEGLEASKMQGKIKAKIKEIKGQWHDLSSEIYTE